MRALEKAVEWLRPLVETKAWDYCVAWKLADDPSSYIEWVSCCCSGGYGSRSGHQGIVKEEQGEDNSLTPICKDTHFQHLVRTKACEALAMLPCSLPLYSGLINVGNFTQRIHGEVVISNQPRWLNNVIASDLNASHTLTGTKVLIPISAGLVELFTTKSMPKDQKFIDYIARGCCVFLEQEIVPTWSCSSLIMSGNPFQNEYNSKNWQQMLHFIHRPHVQLASASSSYPSIEGSSSGSNPSNDYPSFDSKLGYLIRHESAKQSIDKPTASRKPNCHEHVDNQKKILVSKSGVAKEKGKDKAAQGKIRERYLSKNLVTERNRRNRIKDGLYTLRALVPKISKMDRASILIDAIDYVKELQKQQKELQNELSVFEEDDQKNNELNLSLAVPENDKARTECLSISESIINSSGCFNKQQKEVWVEVKQIGTRDLYIEMCFERKANWFSSLMESLDSSGLLVVDVNITTLDSQVLNILKVKTQKDIEPNNLRDFLINKCVRVDMG